MLINGFRRIEINAMRVHLATNEQLKNIIEWDNHCPSRLLFPIYEESVKRDLYKHFILGCIIKFFLSTNRAEQLTKMTIDELKWLSYQKGFEAVLAYKPGNRPFIALWSHCIERGLKDTARIHRAQKRTGDLVDIDEMVTDIPVSNLNTEKTALDRIYIESLFSHMKDSERQIALMRYNGYTLDEIAKVQGVTKSGIQQRIRLCAKRLREVM